MTKSYGALSASLLLALAPFAAHAAPASPASPASASTQAQVPVLAWEEGAALLAGHEAADPVLPVADLSLPEPASARAGALEDAVSPVPEPNIWALLCVGASVLALRGGRDRERSQKLG